MMKVKESAQNFLDINKEFSNLERANFVIIPFGLEKSVSYGIGTKEGPEAIIKASSEVELFDEELKEEIYKKAKVSTINEVFSDDKNIESSLNNLSKVVRSICDSNKIPVVLGGEHTLTLGSFGVIQECRKDITLLQFDAHTDLRDSFMGDKYSHGAVMRRCLEISSDFNLVQVGVRNISNDSEDGSEYDFLKKNKKRIKTFWAKDMEKWKMVDIINFCKKNVYLSFDVDVFDPGIMPSTGTPEPGGLSWYQVLKIIKQVSKKKNIVGMDFVELAPINNLAASDFMVAKLIYKTIGYITKFKGTS